MAGHIDDSLTSMIGIRKHLIRRSLISRSVGLFPTPTRTLAGSIIRSLVIATMKLEPTQGLYSWRRNIRISLAFKTEGFKTEGLSSAKTNQGLHFPGSSSCEKSEKKEERRHLTKATRVPSNKSGALLGRSWAPSSRSWASLGGS